MQDNKFILFDFDGVIVDGINEYWHSSVLACHNLHVSEIISPKISEGEVSKTFIEMRPWVKYGWEMVLIAHEIIKKDKPITLLNKDAFLKNYKNNCIKILKKNGWKPDDLQQSLNNARSFQISSDAEKWLALHQPFIPVVSFINKAQKNGYKVAIISTKGKEFSSKILNRINIIPDNIFGYESGTKIEIITQLKQKFEILGFIEDRRQTLSDLLGNYETKDVPCYLAEWGYLKPLDKLNLPDQIKLLRLKELEDILAIHT